uniref:BEACH domain-containing protein n=1 Tax=Romanomermis culicivorax TaxID=13658 RepID=A0A915IQJ4_ROMCU
NHFDLGIKQSGVQLNDAILPKWARNDPREFIRLHREALESDFVSLHLNEWIDLIFGYKQQGQSAIESCNLFHHLFYEGNVDFESIEDPLTRNATIGFINNFGQIPTQLFKKPHPQKKIRVLDSSLPTQGVTTEKLFFHCLEHLKPPMMTAKELRGPVGSITQNDKGNLCCVEQNKALMPPNNSKYFSWGYADNSVRMGSLENEKSLCVYEMTGCGEVACAFCPSSRTIITGSTSTVVVVWEIIPNPIKATSWTFKFRKALYGHTEQISCVYASANYGILISGSRDATCIVWDLSNLQFIRQLCPDQGPISAVCISEATGDIAVACSTYLFIYSINGTLLASVNTASSPKVDGKQNILCIAFSTLNEWDPQHVILTGSNDGVVRMWSLDFVQVPADAEALDVNGTSSSRKDSPLFKRAPTQMSNVSTAAGDLVPMVDPLKSLDDEFYEGCPDSKLLPTDKEIDVDDLRRRLADENLIGSSDDERPRSTTDHDRPTPKFCVGSVSNSSAGPDSGLGTPHARIESEINETVPKDSFYTGISPLTPTFESRFTDLSNLINNESSSSCTISARSEQLAKRDSSESFVLSNKDGLTTVKTPNKLRKGFKWQRQLVFRYKLTMYTSFERKDNNAPAAADRWDRERGGQWSVGETGREQKPTEK